MDVGNADRVGNSYLPRSTRRLTHSLYSPFVPKGDGRKARGMGIVGWR
jgi:hypothetical protein